MANAIKNKVKIASAHGYDFYVDLAVIKAYSYMDDESHKESFMNALVFGSSYRAKNVIKEAYASYFDEKPLRDELFYSYNPQRTFCIIAHSASAGRDYVVHNNSFDNLGSGRNLRSEVRDSIKAELSQRSDWGCHHNLVDNLWNIAVNDAKNYLYDIDYVVRFFQEGYEAAYDASTPDTPDYVPEPTPEPQPTAPAQVQVTERIIEKKVESPLEDMLKQTICEMVSRVTVDDMVPRIKEKIIAEFGIEPVVHEVKLSNGESHKIDGVVHNMFDTVLHFINNDIPILLYGPAGTGKGVICEQVAESLRLPYHFMNSVTDEFKISGFVDANGIYHETEFYKAFTEGGVFFLDEIDASAPEVLVCLNAAIANRYFTFPVGNDINGNKTGGFKKAHENFRVVAAGNTLGTGADATYTGRLQLDAASLNRFVVVPIDYDINIDRAMANGDEELVEFAKLYRDAIHKVGIPSICSYRNIQQIKVAETAMELHKALLYSLTKEMNKDDINIVYTSMSMNAINNNNKYLVAFKSIEPMVA